MKERPILFSAPMVRALLDGSKTQTRRMVKPFFARVGAIASAVPADVVVERDGFAHRGCPYGQPADRLWVRESWHQRGVWRKPDWPEAEWDDAYWSGSKDVIYAADAARPATGWRGRPSIHMPRWASRILLEIVSVRVERLQDISVADAKAEGITPYEVRQFAQFGATAEERAAMYQRSAVRPYRDLWESLNGAGSWAANPWVWVVEFKRITP